MKYPSNCNDTRWKDYNPKEAISALELEDYYKHVEECSFHQKIEAVATKQLEDIFVNIGELSRNNKIPIQVQELIDKHKENYYKTVVKTKEQKSTKPKFWLPVLIRPISKPVIYALILVITLSSLGLLVFYNSKKIDFIQPQQAVSPNNKPTPSIAKQAKQSVPSVKKEAPVISNSTDKQNTDKMKQELPKIKDKKIPTPITPNLTTNETVNNKTPKLDNQNSWLLSTEGGISNEGTPLAEISTIYFDSYEDSIRQELREALIQKLPIDAPVYFVKERDASARLKIAHVKGKIFTVSLISGNKEIWSCNINIVAQTPTTIAKTAEQLISNLISQIMVAKQLSTTEKDKKQ